MDRLSPSILGLELTLKLWVPQPHTSSKMPVIVTLMAHQMYKAVLE